MKNRVLFQSVRVFDGESERLSEPSNVLIEEGSIRKISEVRPNPNRASR